MSFPVSGGGGSGGSGGSSQTPSGEFDPEFTPPTTFFAYEKFKGGVEEYAWEWGNQGDATITSKNDGVLVFVPNSAESFQKTRWINPPNGSFVATLVFHLLTEAGESRRGGIGVLRSGTVATPTACTWYSVGANGFVGMMHDVYTAAGYGWTTQVGGAIAAGETFHYRGRFYMQVIYDATADTLRFRVSNGGIVWQYHSYIQGSVTSHPVRVGYFARTAGSEGDCELFVEKFIIKNGASGSSLDIGG